MDYLQLKTEILETLLAGQSSQEVSRKLGYSFDQVSRWKLGRKELRWNEFCDLCAVLQVPLGESLREFFQFHSDDFEGHYAFLPFYRKFYVHSALTELSAELGSHPSTLKRVFSGKVFPALELVFALLGRHPMLLGGCLLRLIGKTPPGPLLTEFSRLASKAEIETNLPVASAIEGLLAINEYQKMPTHDESWFCRKLGLEREELRKIWRHLIEARQVIPDGHNKFKPNYTTIHTNGARPEQVCKMVNYWTERARLRFSEAALGPINRSGQIGTNVVTYRITPMSHENARKATEILVKAYREITALAEAAEGPYDDVRVFLLHHFSVEDFPEATDRCLKMSQSDLIRSE